MIIVVKEALSAFLKRDDLLDPTRAKLTKEECKRLIAIALACQTEKGFCDITELTVGQVAPFCTRYW